MMCFFFLEKLEDLVYKMCKNIFEKITISPNCEENNKGRFLQFLFIRACDENLKNTFSIFISIICMGKVSSKSVNIAKNWMWLILTKIEVFYDFRFTVTINLRILTSFSLSVASASTNFDTIYTMYIIDINQ